MSAIEWIKQEIRNMGSLDMAIDFTSEVFIYAKNEQVAKFASRCHSLLCEKDRLQRTEDAAIHNNGKRKRASKNESSDRCEAVAL